MHINIRLYVYTYILWYNTCWVYRVPLFKFELLRGINDGKYSREDDLSRTKWHCINLEAAPPLSGSFQIQVLWQTQFHKPSPSHHHFYGWDFNHPQMAYGIGFPTLGRNPKLGWRIWGESAPTEGGISGNQRTLLSLQSPSFRGHGDMPISYCKCKTTIPRIFHQDQFSKILKPLTYVHIYIHTQYNIYIYTNTYLDTHIYTYLYISISIYISLYTITYYFI